YGYSSVVEGDLRKFSDIGASYAIEDCAQYDKKIANPNAQIVGDDMVRVQVPSSKEVPIFEEPKPQPQPLTNCPSERGPEPPIKPPRLDSFRMKEVDH
ncbi:hypothetical protein Tco_1149426, partial [Tanacetum coccineum]